MNPTAQSNWRKRGARILLALSLFVMLGAIWSAPACRDLAYICENTGSRKGQREWFFGLHTKSWTRESRLEAFMRKEHPDEITNRWVSYTGTGLNVFGQTVSTGHGRPSSIVNVSEERLDRYVDGLAPDERLQLYRLLSSGDRDKIAAAVRRMTRSEGEAGRNPPGD